MAANATARENVARFSGMAAAIVGLGAGQVIPFRLVKTEF